MAKQGKYVKKRPDQRKKNRVPKVGDQTPRNRKAPVAYVGGRGTKKVRAGKKKAGTAKKK